MDYLNCNKFKSEPQEKAITSKAYLLQEVGQDRKWKL